MASTPTKATSSSRRPLAAVALDVYGKGRRGSPGADWQLHAYGHTLHAFTVEEANAPQNGMAYNAAAARRSWASMKAFFEEVFGAA